MTKPRIALSLAMLLLVAGCAPAPGVQSGTLRCPCPWKGGSFIGFYSFTAGEQTPPFSDAHPGQIDLLFYFDRDDCSQGALIGYDDNVGCFAPIGRKSWSDLAKLKPPSKDTEFVPTIAPLTKDKEGQAFWAKTERGKYYLVRIRKVRPLSYPDLVSPGAPPNTPPRVIPTLDLEWLGPRE